MITGNIIKLDERRRTGQVELEKLGWVLPCDNIPAGLRIGDRVQIKVITRDLSPFQRATRAEDDKRSG